MESKIQFINHASVLIEYEDVGLLSDPWYQGDAFHLGWNLLCETTDQVVKDTLAKTTHIWISHEHPDHFSVKFFKNFCEEITSKKIRVLFQKTRDRRVLNFLESMHIECIELPLNTEISLNINLSVTCIPDGKIDSALLVRCGNEKILNLNDCVVRTKTRAREIQKITGDIDLLLTQFSYAAWKGGKNNKKYRTDAAMDKLRSIYTQIEVLKPRFLVPFASFIYFSNLENYYLNDSVNTPNDVITYLSDKEVTTQVCVLKPLDCFDEHAMATAQDEGVAFWQKAFNQIPDLPLNSHQSKTMTELAISFENYCNRIHKNNNLYFIHLMRFLTPIRLFSPAIVKIKETGKVLRIDYVNRDISTSSQTPMIELNSGSLNYIFVNSFGFDTLTVNGCFEESHKGGFSMIARSLGIETFNNVGISFNFKFLLEFRTIIGSLKDLRRVTKNLESSFP